MRFLNSSGIVESPVNKTTRIPVNSETEAPSPFFISPLYVVAAKTRCISIAQTQQSLYSFLESTFSLNFSIIFGTMIPARNRPGALITSIATLYFLLNIKSETKNAETCSGILQKMKARFARNSMNNG